MQKHNTQKGFIALISAILIAVSLLTLTVAVGFGGFFGRFAILDSEVKEMSYFLAEACVNTATIKLIQDEDYAGPDTVKVGEATCEILSIDPVGSSWPKTIEAQGVYQGAYTNLEVEIESDGAVNEWTEVVSF